MQRMISLIVSSFLLLGAAACNQNPDPAATGTNVRDAQVESDARARTQRDGINVDTDTTAGNVRDAQIESDARARAQRDGVNVGTPPTSNEVRETQIESDARAQAQRDGAGGNIAATGTNVRDAQIESDARARAQRDGNSGRQTSGDLAVDVRNSLERNLPGSRMAVDVNGANGRITVDGTVLNQDQFNEIEPLVMAFEGVTSVENKARVRAN